MPPFGGGLRGRNTAGKNNLTIPLVKSTAVEIAFYSVRTNGIKNLNPLFKLLLTDESEDLSTLHMSIHKEISKKLFNFRNMIILFRILIVLLISNSLIAQDKSDYTWVFPSDFLPSFGIEGSILDFNQGHVTISESLFATELGSSYSMISDRNSGELLFYTGGCEIIDSSNQIMENGDQFNAGLIHDGFCEDFRGQYPALNMVITLPSGYHEDFYYLISKPFYEPEEAAHTFDKILMTSVDMSLNEGKGKVIQKNKIVYEGVDFLGSYLTACRHQNGKDWWIIQMEEMTNRYLVFLLDDTGFSFHHDHIEGYVFGDRSSSTGHATFSSDGSIFALYNPHDDLIVFDFDRSAGGLSNYRKVDADNSTQFNELAGSVAISSNNRFAYLASDRMMYQVDLWEDDLQSSLKLIAEWDGFQDPLNVGLANAILGPDCRIYVGGGSGSFHLGVIHEPDLKGQDCMFKQHDLEIPSPKSRGSMPNFPHFRIDETEPCDKGITLASTPIYTATQQRIHTFPNPTQGQISFELEIPLRSKAVLNVYNAMGQLVHIESIKKAMISKVIDVTLFRSGIYYYQLMGAKGIIGSGSFIKS